MIDFVRELIDAIARIVFGHSAVDNAKDLKQAHDKANASREEVEKILRESERPQ